MVALQAPGAPVVLRRAAHLGAGESVYARDVALPPGSAPHLHVHEFYEIALLVSGEGRHLQGTRIEALRPGDVLLVNPAIPHGYVVSGPEPLLVRNVIFTEQALEGVLAWAEVAEMLGLFYRTGQGGGLPRLRPSGALPGLPPGGLLGLAGAMVAEYTQGRPGHQLALAGYLRVLLTAVWRASTAALPAETAGALPWQRLLPALRRIYAEGGRASSVADLASATGWSPDHFSRLFKRTLGQTTQQFLRRLRVHRAAHLLLTSSLALDEIAVETGYADSRALRRAFVACLQSTPEAYRRLAQG